MWRWFDQRDGVAVEGGLDGGEDGMGGLRDRPLSPASQRAAPVEEVMAMVNKCEIDHGVLVWMTSLPMSAPVTKGDISTLH